MDAASWTTVSLRAGLEAESSGATRIHSPAKLGLSCAGALAFWSVTRARHSAIVTLMGCLLSRSGAIAVLAIPATSTGRRTDSAQAAASGQRPADTAVRRLSSSNQFSTI